MGKEQSQERADTRVAVAATGAGGGTAGIAIACAAAGPPGIVVGTGIAVVGYTATLIAAMVK